MNAQEAMKLVNGTAHMNEDGTVVDNDTKVIGDTPSEKQAADTVAESESKQDIAPDNKSQDNVEEKKASDSDNDSADADDKSSDNKVKKNSSKKRYTKEERQKHAFKLQRDKLKESQNRIKELEEKLSKYDGLTKDKFEKEDDYIDYKVDMSSDKRELERLKQERIQQQIEYAKDISEQRILDNFSDSQEQEEYRKLLNIATHNFSALHPEYGIDNFADLIAEDKTVLEYLADSDNSPRLIRHFIAKPESLLKIMRMTSPLNKHAALDKMEQAMVNYFRTKNVKVKPLQSTGRVVNNRINNTSDTDKWNKKWSAQDALNYIKQRGK